MFYVVAEAVDTPPTSYRWCVYYYKDPASPIEQANHSYTSRAAAIDAGWAAVERSEGKSLPKPCRTAANIRRDRVRLVSHSEGPDPSIYEPLGSRL
jgi:hypothetical protein